MSKKLSKYIERLYPNILKREKSSVTRPIKQEAEECAKITELGKKQSRKSTNKGVRAVLKGAGKRGLKKSVDITTSTVEQFEKDVKEVLEKEKSSVPKISEQPEKKITGIKAEQSERKSFKEFWRGKATETSFGLADMNFGKLADFLQSRRKILLEKGQGHLLPEVNTNVLNMYVNVFFDYHSSPGLRAEWNRLRNDPVFKGEIEEVFKAGKKEKESIVKDRKPDFIEFYLKENEVRIEVEISDVTLKWQDNVQVKVHTLKTRFYKEVMQCILGSKGPHVRAFELYIKESKYVEL